MHKSTVKQMRVPASRIHSDSYWKTSKGGHKSRLRIITGCEDTPKACGMIVIEWDQVISNRNVDFDISVYDKLWSENGKPHRSTLSRRSTTWMVSVYIVFLTITALTINLVVSRHRTSYHQKALFPTQMMGLQVRWMAPTPDLPTYCPFYGRRAMSI